jgi:putative ABC transport system permease protein
MGTFLRRLASYFEHRRLEREMDEEMAFHLEMKTRDLERDGLAHEEAAAVARRRFGNLLRTRERCEEFWGWRWLHDLATDVRVGSRMLVRRPAFTATAVVSLTLGIGGVVTVFTLVHSVLLRPLPYREPHQLVAVWAETPGAAFRASAVSTPDYVAWREPQTVFDAVAAFDMSVEANLADSSRPDRIFTQRVTASLFSVLGVSPLVGRPFSETDEREGSAPVAILGHGVWQQRFGGDPTIVGKMVALDGRPHEIVGVMPAGFAMPILAGRRIAAALWTPFSCSAADLRERTTGLSMIARLKRGTTRQRAQAEMTALARQSAPDAPAGNERRLGRVVPLQEQMTAGTSERLLPLGGAVVFLLLIACANVAGLLAAAGADRRPEHALRSALGAGRGRIVRQLLTESLLLGTAGCIGGVALAVVLVGPLVALSPTDLPRRGEIRLDLVVLSFAVGVSLLSTVLVGLLPAVAASSPRLAGWLQSAGRRTTGSRSGQRVRQALVAVQIAVALALCIGGGLMVRSLHTLMRVDVGFDATDVYTFQVRLPEAKYTTALAAGSDRLGRTRVSPAVTPLYDAILERVRRLPGVTAASATPWLPMNGVRGDQRAMDILGRPEPAEGGRVPGGWYYPVHLDFFRTLRIPLLRGRLFDARDTAGSPSVAIIDEELARAFWPNADPVGQHVSFARWGDPYARRIVGIVGSVRHNSLASPSGGSIYVPVEQQPAENLTSRVAARLRMSVVLRTSGNNDALGEQIVRAVGSVDKDVPVFAIAPMRDYLAGSAKQMRFQTLLVSAFGAIAALLAVVGIYGVARYSVAQRTHEIGVRVALGATPGGVTRMVLGGAWRMTVAGLVAGLALAYGLTRFLASMLYSVTPTDRPTYLVVSVVVAIVVVAATYLPARRASRVDPVVALRQE